MPNDQSACMRMCPRERPWLSSIGNLSVRKEVDNKPYQLIPFVIWTLCTFFEGNKLISTFPISVFPWNISIRIIYKDQDDSRFGALLILHDPWNPPIAIEISRILSVQSKNVFSHCIASQFRCQLGRHNAGYIVRNYTRIGHTFLSSGRGLEFLPI